MEKTEMQLRIIDKIDAIMREKNLKQKDLIEGTGIAQSKICKGLNRKGGTNLSIDNICLIADFLNVSVDYLLDRTVSSASTAPATNAEIARNFMNLVENEIIRYVDIEVEENTYQPYNGYDESYSYPYEFINQKNKYKALYFSDYEKLPDLHNLSDVEKEDFNFEYVTKGNASKKGKEINSFIEYYLKLYDLYKNNNLPQDMFETAINDRINQMKY